MFDGITGCSSARLMYKTDPHSHLARTLAPRDLLCSSLAYSSFRPALRKQLPAVDLGRWSSAGDEACRVSILSELMKIVNQIT